MTWKLVPGPIVFTENYHNLHWKMIFLKQSDSIGYVMVKLLKYVQISIQTFSDFFLQGILLK